MTLLRVWAAAGLVAGLACHALTASLAGHQKEPAIGASLLSGRVLDSRTNEPVPEALVTLRRAQPQSGPGAIADRRLPGAPAAIGQVTDSTGRFAFTGLAPAAYSISASKLGYSEGAFGRRRPEGPSQTLSVRDGQHIGNLAVPLWRTASVAGTITDESSEPMCRIPVRALRRILVAGRWTLESVAAAATDDRGVYRIGSLVPGDYIIEVPSTQLSAPESIIEWSRRSRAEFAASAPTGRAELIAGNRLLELLASGLGVTADQVRLQPSFAPYSKNVALGQRPLAYPARYFAGGRTADEATVVSVGVGDERRAVDLALNPVPAHKVSGTVKGPEGPAVVSLSLTTRTESTYRATAAEAAITFSDMNGRFVFPAVPTGEYWLRVAAVPERLRNEAGPSRPSLWLTVPVSVGAADVTDLALTLRQGFRVSGQMEFEGRARPSDDLVRRIVITVESSDGRTLDPASLSRIAIQPDGSFSSSALPEGSYFLRINNAPPGWGLTRSNLGGRDVSKAPLTLDRDLSRILLTLSDRVSEVSGSVQNVSGVSDPDAAVLVFPVESASWTDYGITPPYIRSVRVDSDGSYRLIGLVAGDYFVVAVPEEAAVNWQETKTLKTLAQVASRLVVAPGGAKSLNLRTVDIRR